LKYISSSEIGETAFNTGGYVYSYERNQTEDLKVENSRKLKEIITNTTWASLVFEFVTYNPNTDNKQQYQLFQFGLIRDAAGVVTPESYYATVKQNKYGA
jgi:hypothetical protein